jgi:hypothetical protein
MTKLPCRNGQENRPFDPDGFPLVFDQFRPQVKDDDAQAVDAWKSTEKDKIWKANARKWFQTPKLPRQG